MEKTANFQDFLEGPSLRYSIFPAVVVYLEVDDSIGEWGTMCSYLLK